MVCVCHITYTYDAYLKYTVLVYIMVSLFCMTCRFICDFTELILLYVCFVLFTFITHTSKDRLLCRQLGGGPRVTLVVSTAVFRARGRGSVPGLEFHNVSGGQCHLFYLTIPMAQSQ